MNYLAHLFLAADDDGLLLGALLGDFVKGRVDTLPLPPPVRAGIRLHRQIDTFTDAHPQVLQSKLRFSGPRRRWAGIIVDVAYDHFLAKHWQRFGEPPLTTFTAEAYRLLLAHQDDLPPRLQQIVPRMAAQDWLGSYTELNNVGYALERIGMRLSHGNPLLGVTADLMDAYTGLERDFFDFFPDLMAYVEVQRRVLEPGLGAAIRAPTWQDRHPRRRTTVTEPKRPQTNKMNPGDQAPPGTPGTGQNICPRCSGEGKVDGRECPNCGGTGYVIEGIGGA